MRIFMMLFDHFYFYIDIKYIVMRKAHRVSRPNQIACQDMLNDHNFSNTAEYLILSVSSV